MRMQSFLVAPMMAALALTGCATDGPREPAGTIIGGKRETVFGTACRQADGS